MHEKAIQSELAQISKKTYHRGLVRGTGGNVSVRLDDVYILITPSGVALGDTTVENVIKVNLETLEWLPNDPYIPSKEYRFHIKENLEVFSWILVEDYKTRRFPNLQFPEQKAIAGIDRHRSLVDGHFILGNNLEHVIFNQYVDRYAFGSFSAIQ